MSAFRGFSLFSFRENSLAASRVLPTSDVKLTLFLEAETLSSIPATEAFPLR